MRHNVSTLGEGGDVYFMWNSSKLSKVGDKYLFQISSDLKFKLNFGRDRSNNRTIVDRILSEQYSGCDSMIVMDKDKMFLHLSFKFESEKLVIDNKDLVLGIDLGINRPITMGRSDGEFVRQIEIGESILNTRLQFQKRRRTLSRALSTTKGGHGRDEKMKKLDSIGQKERNYVKTKNHEMSKLVVDYCKKNKIGKVHMEDLTGITKDSTEYYLKSWSYHQIQSMIKYKCDEQGIEVNYVKPKDTSKTCHCCGVVQDEARDKEDVSKFVCTTVDCSFYGKIQDADVNAAKNIAKKSGQKEKPLSKKGKIENWKKKQENLVI